MTLALLLAGGVVDTVIEPIATLLLIAVLVVNAPLELIAQAPMLTTAQVADALAALPQTETPLAAPNPSASRSSSPLHWLAPRKVGLAVELISSVPLPARAAPASRTYTCVPAGWPE